MTEEPDTLSIPMDDNSKAYYRGVAAGIKASDRLNTITTPASHLERLSYFWLTVGTLLAEAIPGAPEEASQLFIQGAGLRAPQQRPVAVTFEITSTDGAAFGHSEYDFDEEKAAEEIARIMNVTAGHIRDGAYEGELRDSSGRSVGSFTIRFDHRERF